MFSFSTLPSRFPDGFDENFYSVVVQERNAGEVCPLGFICSPTKQANCADIQKNAIDVFQFGDIHGGAYCPEGSNFYQLCPLGSYCPDPITIKSCPAGFFCPHKTRNPEILCERCPEGATTIHREIGGIVLCIIFSLLIVVYLVSTFFQTRIANWKAKLEDAASRILTKQLVEYQEKEYQQRLARIRPQLEIIRRRLRDGPTEEGPEFAASTSATLQGSHAAIHLPTEGHNIEFNAGAIFNAIDFNDDGVVTYEELNTILQLDHLVLKDFMRRMNALSSTEEVDQKFVTKENFVQYFLEVLEETSHLRPTPAEAADLWDEMYRSVGDRVTGEVPFDAFNTSSLGHFLTDVQIRDVAVGMMKACETERALYTSRAPKRGYSRLVVSGDPMEGVSKDVFVVYYPGVLEEILATQDEDPGVKGENGIDITFQNLNLVVTVGSSDGVKIVNDLSGRVARGTMTALLGGSGAGKTSLLNALCGRAYYGEVRGSVFINGHRAAVEDFADRIGFVPQDDIVYAELTVRENLIYSGRFRLPKGTALRVIEDLADSVLAKLGLSRKANSIVGDVTRRGVSGGEKKRVNIGLELMAKPTALFLDEPTSGLDASSALLVMMSLKQLVSKDGVTVCSVIHQPRTFIFDLFHSVILLGAGGRMVYHGPVFGAHEYFSALGYELPAGESLADWLIDISSGRIAPRSVSSNDGVPRRGASRTASRETKPNPARRLQSIDISSKFSRQPPDRSEVRESRSVNANQTPSIREPTRKDSQAITASCPSSNKADRAENEAKVLRELLYKHWEEFFQRIDSSGREIYYPPEPFAVPEKTVKPSFWTQTLLQLKRILLLAWRNRVSKMIDTTLIVFSALVMSILVVGVTKLSEGIPTKLPFEAFVAGDPQVIAHYFPALFAFTTMEVGAEFVRYGLSLGLITAILVSFTSVKAITEKRIEFFREAGSGYNISAYFLAINVCTTIEKGVQLLFAAIFAQWARNSISPIAVFFIAFQLVGWICMSWSLLIALVTPPKSTSIFVGFYMTATGLLFSGGKMPPGTLEAMYNNPALNLFCSFVSPIRFFIETLAVSEAKCLPAQTGFTSLPSATNFKVELSSFEMLSWGLNDVNVTDKSCNGWYWNFWPAFFVGLTVRYLSFGVINTFNLEQQAKKSFFYQLRHQGPKRLYRSVGIFLMGALVLIIITCVLVLR